MCGGGFVYCLVRKIIRKMALLCMVVYTFFDLSLSKQEQKDLGEFKVSLFCIKSFGQSERHSETLSEEQFFSPELKTPTLHFSDLFPSCIEV